MRVSSFSKILQTNKQIPSPTEAGHIKVNPKYCSLFPV